MNVKLQITEVINLLPSNISPEQLHKLLNSQAQIAGITLPSMKIGHGYLLWTLEGDNWQTFEQLDSNLKPTIAEIYQQRINKLKTSLGNSPYKETILQTPSEDFIFVRPHGTDYEIALTAWGHKFPNKAPIVDLNSWVKHVEKEKVKIAFKWGENLMPQFPFKLAEEPRMTTDNGWFICDGMLPVGNIYTVSTLSGKCFELVVEKDKQEYTYDLTTHANICVKITKDNSPLPNTICNVTFLQKSYSLQTDATGTAILELILKYGADGNALTPQPLCTVSYNDEHQEKSPTPDAITQFCFEIFTEKKEEIPTSPIKHIENDSIEETESEPEPIIEPTEEKVRFTLLDYKGFPLADMPFTLYTKKKGSISLITGVEGQCTIPKHWLTPGEKLKVSFDVTPEYQQSHDIHRTSKNK